MGGPERESKGGSYGAAGVCNDVSKVERVSPLGTVQGRDGTSISVFSDSIGTAIRAVHISASIQGSLRTEGARMAPGKARGFTTCHSSCYPTPGELPEVYYSVTVVGYQGLLAVPKG